MFLFCDVNSPNDLCCYVIESGGKNKNLWNKNPIYRDNGVVTIGTIIGVIMPKKITTLMANEIMILETTLSAIIMKRPLEQIKRLINYSIPPRVSADSTIIGNVI